MERGGGLGGSWIAAFGPGLYTYSEFMHWIIPLSLLIVFELVADILAKQWSVKQGFLLAAGALAAYLIANSFWLFALRNGSGLARGAIMFSVASGVVATLLGVLLFKEHLTRTQFVGIVLGLVSVFFLFGNE